MNRAERIRKLRALIDDPATFEGERDNARRMLERLGATTEAPQEARGQSWTYGTPPRPSRVVVDDVEFDGVEFTFDFGLPPSAHSFEEILRAFRHAAKDAER